MSPTFPILPKLPRSSSGPPNEHLFPGDDQPRAIVKRFYDGGTRGEITSFRDSLAENFEFIVPPQLPWGGTFNKASTSWQRASPL